MWENSCSSRLVSAPESSRWWGYKVYHVTNHRHKTYIMRNELKNLLNILPTLDLELVDGSQISIPDIESKQWKLYPEYRTWGKKLKKRGLLPGQN